MRHRGQKQHRNSDRRRGDAERGGGHEAIPSRERIINYLTGVSGPQDAAALARGLRISQAKATAALSRRLEAMVRSGELIRNRRGAYGLVDKMELASGRVIGHPDGFGFLARDQGGDDVYLPAHEMQSVLHGDRALVRVSAPDKRGRVRGSIVEILERGNREVVGRFHVEDKLGYVVPDNRRIHQDVLIPKQDWKRAAEGNIVVAEILKPPDRHHQPIGRVVEILGDALTPKLAIDIAIRAHELPRAWDETERSEAKAVPQQVRKADRRGRVDLRELPLVTIDGEDARDFDDAVYCESRRAGWRLLVAIADVSHYVKPGSALDRAAQARGTSVYFPDRVIPMLPVELSNGICSLNPEVERLCMVCELSIDRRGHVTTAKFYDAVMRSAARLTYTEVAAIVVERKRRARDRRRALVPHLEELYRLYKALRRRRNVRGAIDFDSIESKIMFDEQGSIDKIVPVEITDAHRIIEECMIAANVAAAEFILDHELPGLFRIHPPPAEERIEDVKTFLGELGLYLGRRGIPEPKDYGKLLRAVAERPDRHLIQTILLRSLQLATYSADNVGHFGLAFDAYTHFTSPIRRYPDLLVHRAIRSVLRKRKAGYPYDKDQAAALGEHCSMTERRADEATRDAIAWLKCEYMAEHVGACFDGVVSSVTGFGLFVELDEVYVEGLVHISALPADYYHFDPVRHCLDGERTGRRYRLLDRLRVQVVRVDLDERKIDFELVDGRKR